MTPAPDEAEIRRLVTEVIPATREKDAHRIIARYAPNIVRFDLAPPLRHPPEQTLDAVRLRGWMDGFEDGMEYEVKDLQVTIGGTVAFCHALHRLSATPRGGPEGFDLWMRSTIGLEKIDGEWRITHEHESTPFYMDGSFRAAVDLEP